MPEFNRQFRAMGTDVGLWLWHTDEALAGQALAQTEQFFIRAEAQLSRFQADSELSRLNRAAGRPYAVSPLLFDLVELALAWRDRTGGIFDPTVLRALIAHGYDRSFEQIARRGDGQVAPAPASHPAGGRVRLSPAERRIWLPSGVGLDLGGIAKGWAVQQAAHRLGRLGPALVDAGGDIACVGAPPTGSRWLVGIADPHRPEADLAALTLADEAVATSSLTGRRWQYHGRPAHHLIDPRTGAPAVTDLASVTVVAPRLPDAEIHAKVALILGSADGLAYLDKQPGVAALLVTAAGDQLSCGPLEDKAYVYSPTFTRTFLTLV
jgi:thiamine biosynthesis lipoprotein